MDSERSADSAGKTPAPMDVTVTFAPSAPGTPRHQSDTVRQQQPPSDPLPSFVGRFEIRALLGSGGFGKVLLAFDPVMQRRVALKVGRNFVTRLEQLIHEARSAARVQHPHVVTVYEAGNDEFCGPWVAMEYVEGESLDQWMKRQPGPCPLDEVFRIMIPVAEGVHVAHKHGVYHRDLKPGNILLGKDRDTVKVADFGLAIFDDTPSEDQNRYAGTLAYSSPEQVRGESDGAYGRSDVWSLGVILYELLSGQRPFAPNPHASNLTEDLRRKILDAEPKPLEQLRDTVPLELVELCRDCLAKEISRRPPTALAVARRLREVASRGPTTFGRRRLLWGIGGACGAALCGSVLARWWFAPSVVPTNPEAGDRNVDAGATPPAINKAADFDLQPVVWDDGYTGNSFGIVQPGNVARVSCVSTSLVSFGQHTDAGFTAEIEMSQNRPAIACGLFWALHSRIEADGTRRNFCRGIKIYVRQATQRLCLWPCEFEIVNRSIPWSREFLPLELGDAGQHWTTLRVTAKPDGNVLVDIGTGPRLVAQWTASVPPLPAGKLGVIVVDGDVLMHQVKLQPLE